MTALIEITQPVEKVEIIIDIKKQLIRKENYI